MVVPSTTSDRRGPWLPGVGFDFSARLGHNWCQY